MTSRSPPLPLDQPLLAGLTVTAYGAEERVVAAREDGRIVVRCRPGNRPAGIILDPVARRWPEEARLALTWRALGDEGFEGAILGPGEDQRSVTVLRPGAVTALRLGPIESGGPAAPARLAINCPREAATLILADLRLASDPVAGAPSDRPPGVALWAWRPGLWRDEPDRLLARAAALRADRVFVAVEIAQGAVRDADRLAAFTARAREAGVAVVVVEGDPEMALPPGRAVALDRLAAIRRHQDAAPAAGRLAGIQYDIEPYLLDAYRLDPKAVWRGLADTILASRRAADGLPLDVVLPFWAADDARARAEVLPALIEAAERVTVMAYRTDGAAIQAAAEPLLAWASRHGKPLHVALEAGPVEDEAQEVYGPAREGRLWVAPQPDGRALALLLTEPCPAEGGARAYGLIQVTESPAHRVSFLGDEARLLAEAAAARRAFAAWSAFSGFALHGLID